jgi:hypothetical protein
MEHVITAAGDATVTLFATDLGRPLYEKLGFAPVRRSVSFVGTFQPGRADRIAVLVDHARPGISGYAAAWRNTPSSTVVGPLVALDVEAAKRLITDLAARAHGTIRLDLDPDRTGLPAWAGQHGLEPVSRTLVMARGDLPVRGTPERLFTPISVALA